MLYWGHEWQWGYYKHPPLAAWVAEASTLATDSVWPTYLASQLCVVGCFVAVWLMARRTLQPWPSLMAVFLLEACYYYNFTTPELNNNILAKVTWAWSALFLYWAITDPSRWRNWIAAGACLGLALLSKYDAAILIVALLGFSFVHPRARGCWRFCGPYLTVLAALLVFAPHLCWLVENDFPTIRYALERSENLRGWSGHLVNPISFAASQLMAVGFVLLLARRLFQPGWRKFVADDRQAFQRQYLLWVLLAPFLLVLFASLVTGSHIRSMWGSPLWTYLGVVLLLTFQVDCSRKTHEPLLRVCVTLMVVLAVAFGARNLLSPYLRAKPSRVHFPGRLLAAAVEERWHERQHDSRIPMVAGDWWAAGNVGFFYPGRVSVYAEASHEKSPWSDDSQLAVFGGIILSGQDTDDETFDEWLARFPQAEELEPISIPWQTGAGLPAASFRVAVIDPLDNAADHKVAERSTNLGSGLAWR